MVMVMVITVIVTVTVMVGVTGLMFTIINDLADSSYVRHNVRNV
jgi:hypothetical protein